MTGRRRRGRGRKLSDAQVEAIRDAYDLGAGGYRRLARQYGVSYSTVRDIVTFRRRAGVPDDWDDWLHGRE